MSPLALPSSRAAHGTSAVCPFVSLQFALQGTNTLMFVPGLRTQGMPSFSLCSDDSGALLLSLEEMGLIS